MPQLTESLTVLTARPPLSLEEWCQLIELSKEMLSSHLDKMKLRKLQEVNCLYEEGHYVTMGYVQRVCSASGLSEKTQGIFGGANRSKRKYYKIPDETLHNDGFGYYPRKTGRLSIWGLTRKRQWVIALVTFAEYPGYKERGVERAVLLRIEEVPLPTMIKLSGFTPREIWQELAKPFREYVKRRRDQYLYLERVQQFIDTEELLALGER